MSETRYQIIGLLEDVTVRHVETDSETEMITAVATLVADGPPFCEVRMYERGRPVRIIPAPANEMVNA